MRPAPYRARRLLANGLRRLANRLAPSDQTPSGARPPGGPPVAGPPKDWLERVRRGAPELVEPGGGKMVEARPAGPELVPQLPAAPFSAGMSAPAAARSTRSGEGFDGLPPVTARAEPSAWPGAWPGAGTERPHPGPWSGQPPPSRPSDPPALPALPVVTARPERRGWPATGKRPFPPAQKEPLSGADEHGLPAPWSARDPSSPIPGPAPQPPLPPSVERSRRLAAPTSPESAIEYGRSPEGRRRSSSFTSRPAPMGVVEVPHRWPDLPEPERPDEDLLMARASLLVHERERRLEREQRG